MSFRIDGGQIVGSSETIGVAFDAATGGLSSVTNLVTGHRLLETSGARPWRLTAPGTSSPFIPFNRPASYRFESIDPDAFAPTIDGETLQLSWTTTNQGISVRVDVRFAPDGSLELWPAVEVGDDTEPPLDLTYPILAGVKQLSDDDVLVFPAHSGWLVRRPLAMPFPISAPYPDGYNGCSVQMLAYFEQDAGGFYIATHDPHSTWKTFTFGSETTIKHDNWDLRRGSDMRLDYPVVIASLERGDWYEAAERYRSWVVENAPWCDGPRGGASFLRDEVGVSLWCTPSALDWSRWYRFYEDVFDHPLHIVAGWEWPATRPHTVGYEGWFPARFHENNLEAWTGHYVTPYMNDCFISPAAEDFIERWEPNLVVPYSFFTFAPFTYPSREAIQGSGAKADPRITTDNPFYLCPSTAAQRELHAWRDLHLVADYGMAGSFYDISSGNPMLFSRCLRLQHDHPPGGGRHMIEAIEAVNRASKDLVQREAGSYLVQGTETIIENVIGSIDFNVSRAAAGPMGVLEASTHGPEEPPGTGRELIPLFQSIYHDIGPVHEDGWIRLIAEEGDLFYWIAARIYLHWGGIMSVHYPLDAAERPPGYDGPSETISWSGEHLVFDELPELDRSKTAFINELASARTTFARPYLSYGRMVRPVSIDAGTIDLSFDQRLPGITSLSNAGTWTVPRIVHSAWRNDESGRVGLVFVNLHADEATTLHLDVDVRATWGLERQPFLRDVELLPRRVVLVEIEA